jgi:WD40 repeat protein
VLLYGDSGVGKSSIVNAGLLPASVADGIACERLRLRPTPTEEIALERIVSADGRILDSVLLAESGSASRSAFSIEDFARQVRAAAGAGELLLIFDHFEDIVVLFEDDRQEARRQLVTMLIDLLSADTLKVKLLLVFREDYLGWIGDLFAQCPERYLSTFRLLAPNAGELERIIRGPFERFPGHFGPEITPLLARRLVTMLAKRFGSGDVSLAEVQTVCLRLWQSRDPELLLETRRPQGILEDYLNEELDALSSDMREVAVALLSEMVTPAGTRNVISDTDLTRRISRSTTLPPSLVTKTLERLDQRSRLVHCERRREIRLYEITSEFLIPWINEQYQQSELQLERRREQRRRQLLWRIAAGAGAVSVILAVVTTWALSQRGAAKRAATVSHRETVAARSLALLSVAQEHLEDRLDVSVILAHKAYEIHPGAQARNILTSALEEAHAAGLIGVLHGLTTKIASLTISPDGETLAAGANDGVVMLWDMKSRRRVAEISAGTSLVKTVAFSPNGRSFVTGDEDGTIRLWNAQTHRQQGGSIETHDRVLESVAFSPSGQTLAAGGLDGPLSLWSVASHRELGAPIAAEKVGSVAFSPDGQVVATGSYGRTVQLWKVNTRRPLGPPLMTLTNQVIEVAFNPTGHTLATLTTELFGEGRVQLWDVASHKQLGRTIGDHKELGWFAFSPSGRTLTAGGNGGTAVWTVPTGREVAQPLRDGAGHIEAVALSPDGEIVASADQNQVELSPATSPQPLETIKPPLDGRSETKLVEFGPDQRTLISASGDGRLRRWELARHAQPISTLNTRPAIAQCRVLSPDGDTIAAIGRFGAVWSWSLADGGSSQALANNSRLSLYGEETEPDHSCDQQLSFSPNSRTLAIIAGEDGKEVQLWDTASHSVIGHLLAGGESFDRVTFSANGHVLVTVSSQAYSSEERSHVEIWEAGDASRVDRFAIDAHIGQIVTPDGKTLAFISHTDSAELGGVLVWSTVTHRAQGYLPLSQSESISSIALRPDERTLATASGEGGGSEEVQGRVQLWDLASLRALGSPISETAEPVASMVFSPTGNALAFVGEHGAIKLWRGVLWSSSTELRDKVCKLVGEGLTRTEWADYVPGVPYQATC